MSHARKTIRNAIATILKASPTNWSSVLETRTKSPRQIWPYLRVFSGDETSSAITVNNPKAYERNVIISIVGLLRLPGTGDTQTIEDKMDAMAAEIETKLTQTTLRASVSKIGDIEIIATTMDVIEGEEEIDFAILDQTWKVSYSTLEGLPEAFI